MDTTSFEIFFNAYYQAVLNYCHTLIRNSDDAHDIVQQAFMKIWQKRNSLPIPTATRAYLYKIVYNLSMDYLKHQSVKHRHSDYIKMTGEIYNQNVEEDNSVHVKINAAILNLPPKCRKVFVMSRIENKKYREIAAELDLSEKTIENHIGKALKLLRKMLRDTLNA